MKTKTYLAWESMLRRCLNPSQDSYRLYGARGITVCPQWRSFPQFLQDMGECPPGLSLDREDNERGYEPGNCRWIAEDKQQRNKRTNRVLTFNGRTMCIAEWADEIGIKQKTLRARIFDHGWTIERALTEPLRL